MDVTKEQDALFLNLTLTSSIATDPRTGKRLFISQIPLMPSDTQFPFQLWRKRFPIKLTFFLAANKSRGHTLDHVGVSWNLTSQKTKTTFSSFKQSSANNTFYINEQVVPTFTKLYLTISKNEQKR